MQVTERAEGISAAVVNLTGAGLVLESARKIFESVQANQLDQFTAGAAQIVFGALIIFLADTWKEKIRDQRRNKQN